MSKGGITGERLKSFIERVERLEEEKAVLSADVKDVYSEAKHAGFDTKTIRKIVALRKQDPQDRREQAELLELYMHAIGMEDGELSADARKRFEPKPDDPDEPSLPFGKDKKEPPPPPDVSVEEARNLGRQAAQAGKPVTTNPFPSGDPRRAAWDEEWCKAAGSDGMDIPQAWQRSKKPKDDKKGKK